MSHATQDFFANLLDLWAHEDFDAMVDQECPVDGNFIPVQQKVEVAQVWRNAEAQFNPMTGTLVPRRDLFTGGMIGAGRAIREERLGTPTEAMENIFEAESEDHLDALKEALGVPMTLSFTDAVNSVNVY